MSESSYSDALSGTLKQIEAGTVGDEESKQLLRAMTSAAKHTLRTNVHVEDRWALSLRLDPRFFESILPPVSTGFSNLPCNFHGGFKPRTLLDALSAAAHILIAMPSYAFDPVYRVLATHVTSLDATDGTFFIAGRHFNGYHNRFRDIARGGLRVVLPPSEEAYSAESRRHYMECFGLR